MAVVRWCAILLTPPRYITRPLPGPVTFSSYLAVLAAVSVGGIFHYAYDYDYHYDYDYGVQGFPRNHRNGVASYCWDPRVYNTSHM